MSASRSVTPSRLLSAVAAAAALACSTESPEEPSLKPAPTPLAVSPATLQFAIPQATPGTLTVTTQGSTWREGFTTAAP